jgi:hypothetical protein
VCNHWTFALAFQGTKAEDISAEIAKVLRLDSKCVVFSLVEEMDPTDCAVVCSHRLF